MDNTMRRTPADVRRWAASVAVLAAVADLVLLVTLHALVADVDPLRAPTSDYAHASAVAQVAPFAAGVGALALAVATWSVTAGRRARAGLAFLAVFAAAKLVQTFFPIDPAGVTTTSGAVHDVTGNVAFFVLPLAALLLGRPVASVTGRGATILFAWLVLATTVGVLVGDALGLFGLAQRLYLVTAAAWSAVTALTILVPTREADGRPATTAAA